MPIVPKNDTDPRVARAREAPNIRAFLVWARFPFWTIEETSDGTRVSVSDLRFAGRGAPFVAVSRDPLGIAEPPEGGEIHRVERVGFDRPAFLAPRRLLGFDQDRQPGKATVVQDPAERLFAEAAASDVLVAIDAAAARLLRVVPVKHLQPVEPDDALEGVERLAISRLADDVVAGGDEVAGVEADADRVLNP